MIGCNCRLMHIEFWDDINVHRFIAAFGNESYLDCPEGMALGPNNTLYVASFLDDRVVKFSLPDGAFLGVVSLQRDAICLCYLRTQKMSLLVLSSGVLTMWRQISEIPDGRWMVRSLFGNSNRKLRSTFWGSPFIAVGTNQTKMLLTIYQFLGSFSVPDSRYTNSSLFWIQTVTDVAIL